MTAELGEYGRSPLHSAAASADRDDAERLIAAGTDVNLADRAGWTPLHFACQARSADLVGMLLNAGAEVDPVDQHGNTPLWRAVFGKGALAGPVRLLLDAGADPDRRNFTDRSARDIALGFQVPGVVELFD